jgi:hypothetical protein
MRTSLVNRRRLAEMREQEVINMYVKKQTTEGMWSLIGMLYFTFCYFMPDIFGGERNPDCSANTALATAMFGWVVLGS